MHTIEATRLPAPIRPSLPRRGNKIHPAGGKSFELHVLAQDLCHDHGQVLAELACLVEITKASFSRLGVSNNTNLAPMIELQRECVNLMAAARGYSMADVETAIAGLQRSAKTATYLASIPD